MVRRTKEEALATRERIIDAAEAVFHAKGVAHASLEEVAAAAGVTRGAIYWHFRDKGELFEAMMQRVVLPAEGMAECPHCEGGTDPLATLRGAVLEVLVRTAGSKRLQRIFDIAYHRCEYVGDAAGVRDRHIASQKACLKTIESGFRAAIRAGQLPADLDPRRAAVGAMSLVSGLIANWVLDPTSFSLRNHAEALVDVYFRGLGAAAPAASKDRRGKRKS